MQVREPFNEWQARPSQSLHPSTHLASPTTSSHRAQCGRPERYEQDIGVRGSTRRGRVARRRGTEDALIHRRLRSLVGVPDHFTGHGLALVVQGQAQRPPRLSTRLPIERILLLLRGHLPLVALFHLVNDAHTIDCRRRPRRAITRRLTRRSSQWSWTASYFVISCAMPSAVSPSTMPLPLLVAFSRRTGCV
jgi:hypothetical protein